MKEKHLLSVLLVAIFATFLGLVIYWVFHKQVELKDVLPSMITGIVTFVALLFTYWNNQEQREILLKTTVEKEWLQGIRTEIAIMLDKAPIIAVYKRRKSNNEQVVNVDEYVTSLNEISVSQTTLSLFLNTTVPLQKELLLASNILFGKCSNVKTQNDVTDVENQGKLVIVAWHNLYDTYK